MQTSTKLTAPAIIALLSMFISGCGQESIKGEGAAKQDNRQVSEFTSADIKGDFKIAGEIGSDKQLVISSNPNILPYIESFVKSDTLTIKTSDSVEIQPSVTQNIWFTTKEFNALNLHGSSQFQMTGMKTKDLNLNLFGAHKLALQGKADNFKIVIKGSSSVNAKDLQIKNADIEINGSGVVALNVTDHLKVNINGDGKVVYYGKQPKIEQTIHGSGQVSSAFGGVTKQTD